MPDACRAVEFEMKLALFAAGFSKVLLLPILEFVDELDGVIAGFGDFFQTLRKRKIAEDGPKHHGERKRDAVGFGCAGLSWKNCAFVTESWRSRGKCRTDASAHEFATAHLKPQAIHCGRFSKHTRRVQRRLPP